MKSLTTLPMPAQPPLLSPLLWQGVVFEWLWVYAGTSARAQEWSQEITVPPGVFFVERGQVKIRADGNETDVMPGQAFFSGPGKRRQWFEKDTRLLSVGLRCQWPDGLPLYQEGLNVAVLQQKIQPLHQATLDLFNTVHGGRAEVTYAEATQATSRTLGEWARREGAFRQWFIVYVETLTNLGLQARPRQNSGDRRLERLRTWLQHWPLDRTLDLQEVAAELGLSQRHVHQLLRDELGPPRRPCWSGAGWTTRACG